MAYTYDTGDVVRCTAVFTDAAGSGVNPTTVTFTFRDPAGTVVSYVYGVDPEVVRPETGTFYIDVPVEDQDGVWHIRCVGTGDNAAAGESHFIVRPSRFPEEE